MNICTTHGRRPDASLEAYGMTASQPLKSRPEGDRPSSWRAQNPGKAWRYSGSAATTTRPVSGWAVMALKSAELSS